MIRGAGYAAANDLPVYARAMRLRHVRPSGTQCFVLFEGMIVVGALLALAELVPWWGVFALPAAVGAMVKVNDLIVGRTPGSPCRCGDRTSCWARDDRRLSDLGGPDAAPRRAGRPGGLARHDRQRVGASIPSVRGHARVVGRAAVPVRSLAPPLARNPLAPDPLGRDSSGPDRAEPRTADENTTLGLAHAGNVWSPADAADSPRQRARQSAVRRYE